MGKSFTFPSVARPTFRYRLFERDDDNPAHDWRRSRSSISSCLSQFDTMGDGETQHSPDALVHAGDTFDVIESLAASLHLIDINVDDEQNSQSKVLSWFWRNKPSASDAEIQFAIDLKYNPKKETYFTFVDNGPRKSHSEAKRHDRRWSRLHEMPEDMRVVDRVLSFISADDSNIRPNGIINHIATVFRIAQVADKDSWQYEANRHLQSKGAVFEKLDRSDMQKVSVYFERITAFKEAAHNICWARSAARNHQQRMAEERAPQPVA